MKQKLGNGMRLPFVEARHQRDYCRFVIPPGLADGDFPEYLKEGLESTRKQLRLDQKFAFATKEGADLLFQWWCMVFEWMGRSKREVFESLKQHSLINEMLDTRKFKEAKTRTVPEAKTIEDKQRPQREVEVEAAEKYGALVPLSDADIRFLGADKQERIHDLRLAKRLGYAHHRQIRELIERKKEELEDVGVLIFQASYDATAETTNGEGGYWLNFQQALLVAMAAETKESRATRRELARLADAFRRGEIRQSDPSSEILKTLVQMQGEQNALVKQTLNAMTTMMAQRQPTAEIFDTDGRRRNISQTWYQWEVLTDGSAVSITDVAKMVETFSGQEFSFQKVKDWVTKEGGRWEMLPVHGDKRVTLLAACPSHLLDCFCAAVDDIDSGLRGAHIKYRMACTREGARKIARLIVDDLRMAS